MSAPSAIPSSSSDGKDDHSDAKIHDRYMRLALDEAAKCIPTPTAFCVGCVIVLPQSQFQSIMDEWPPRDAEMNSSTMRTTTEDANAVNANLDSIVANDDNTEARCAIVLSTGYSRELPGNTHAEANALAKLRALSPGAISALLSGTSIPISSLFSGAENAHDGATAAVEALITLLLRHADVYTTLEPCSVRTSGLAPCADALIAARVRRCFIGVGEPDDFVQCEGARKMQEAGVEIVWLRGWQGECLAAARRGH